MCCCCCRITLHCLFQSICIASFCIICFRASALHHFALSVSEHLHCIVLHCLFQSICIASFCIVCFRASALHRFALSVSEHLHCISDDACCQAPVQVLYARR